MTLAVRAATFATPLSDARRAATGAVVPDATYGAGAGSR